MKSDELKDFVENMIVGRIQMLVKARLSEEEQKITDDAQKIIRGLDEEKNRVMVQWLDSLMDREAENEVMLYKGGFKDGFATAVGLSQILEGYSACFGTDACS